MIYYKAGNKKTWSTGERRFSLYWKTIKGDAFLTEVSFHPERKWRFDFAWPEIAVAMEIEGGVFQKKGGHTTGSGYTKDCEKYNEAIYLGWTILRFTTAQVTVENLLRLNNFLKQRKNAN